MDPKSQYLSKPWLQFYSEKTPHESKIPEKSIPEIFDESAEKNANRTALVYYGKNIRYSELKELSDRFAAALVDMGVKKGDVIGLFLVNCPQYVISYFGILKAGATVTPISPVYTSKEVKYQIEDSGASMIICQDILLETVLKTQLELKQIIVTNVSEYLPFWKKIFSKGSSVGKTDSRVVDFRLLLQKFPPNPPAISIDPKKQIASLSYSGGTTGYPKAAVLSHYNLIASLTQVSDVFWMLQEGKESVAAFLPFSHIYGQVVVMLYHLFNGWNIVLFTTPDIDKILAAMERYQVTLFIGVPTLFDYLREYEKTDRVNWKRLNVIISGSDTLHASTIEGWEKRTASPICEGFGTTEVCSVSHLNPLHRIKKGSFGIPLPGIKAAVIDHESDEFVPIGEVGEMIVSGKNVMMEYWKRPEENKQALLEIEGEKWYRTGDLVRMDEEGYFFFFDRKRDVIKYKGYSVFARHVEELLSQHMMVKAAGVVGVPDPKVGAFVKAYIVLQPEARGKISEEDFIEYCKENLAHYKVPKSIEFRGELPKTDVGKISRRELREEEAE